MGNTIHWGWIPDCIKIERASWTLSKHTCIALHFWLWMWCEWLLLAPVLTSLQWRLTCLNSLIVKAGLSWFSCSEGQPVAQNCELKETLLSIKLLPVKVLYHHNREEIQTEGAPSLPHGSELSSEHSLCCAIYGINISPAQSAPKEYLLSCSAPNPEIQDLIK